MRIVVTGATGFVGQALVQRLAQEGHDVQILIRKPRTGLPPQIRYSIWDALQNDPPVAALEGAEAVIHLAGAPITQRWTDASKRDIRASRAGGTQRLIAAMSQLSTHPRVLISGSAVGYYGSRGDEILTEASPPGQGFLAEVCEEWESAANLGLALNMRVVRLRTGIVLGREGGALARMLPAFRAGAGGRLGSGEQWMSWIHLDDLVAMILAALTNEKFNGAVNAVAPGPVRNSEFTQSLASELRRPAIFPAPMFLLRLLFGELADAVFEASQRVMPAAAEKAGFEFRFTELRPALRDLLRS
jgi:uncharacterized protein (TIGR01777 family)